MTIDEMIEHIKALEERVNFLMLQVAALLHDNDNNNQHGWGK